MRGSAGILGKRDIVTIAGIVLNSVGDRENVLSNSSKSGVEEKTVVSNTN